MSRDAELKAAFERALKSVLRMQEKPLPPAEVAELAAKVRRLRQDQLRFYMANSRKAARVEVVKRLLAEAAEAVQHGPEEARAAAEAAAEAAEALPAPGALSALKQDLRAEALCYVANAERLAERYDAAEALWQWVGEVRRDGSGDPLLWAKLEEWKASLRIDQQQFNEANRLLAGAVRVYELLAETQALAIATRVAARCAFLAGEPELAFRKHWQAIEATPKDDLATRYIIWSDMVLDLEGMGMKRQAWGLAEEMKELCEIYLPPMLRLRARWTLGRLRCGAGLLEGARRLLEDARREFLDQGLAFDAALVALDLAVVHAQAGNPDAQKALAEEMLPVFTGLRLHTEANAALLLYVNAARNYRVTREFIKSLVGRFEPLRRLGPGEAPLPG